MYFNTLIIMNEDALGYGNRSRKPSGYCKLTMPNRVSCYVQGLRQLPKGQIYKLYLTSKSKQKSVEVGMLQVGANGNKETRWVMNPTSINNTGINAEEIDGAFIIVSGDDIKGNVVPLVGFSSEPYIWEHLVKNNQEIATAVEKEPEISIKTEATRPTPPNLATEAKAEPQPIDVIADAKIDAQPTDVIADAKNDAQPADVMANASQPTETVRQVPEPTEADLPPEIAPMHDIDPIFSDEDFISHQPNLNRASSDEVLALKEEVVRLNQTIQESKAIIEALQRRKTREEEASNIEESKSRTEESRNLELPTPKLPDPVPTHMEPLEKVSGINDYINNFIRRFQAAEKEHPKDYQRDNCVKAKDIFEKRIPINPFEAQDTGIKWVRITHDDLVSLPSLDHGWTNQAMMMDAHRDYKHFILGRDESELAYYVGIPDVFDPAQESGLNIDKIERFSCCHNVQPTVGEAGYWIARI